MKLTTIAAAAAMMILPSMAFADCLAGQMCETGTVILDSAGANCFKFHLVVPGKSIADNFAVVYGLTPSEDAVDGYLTLLENGSIRSIVFDGQALPPECGNSGHVVTGVRIN